MPTRKEILEMLARGEIDVARATEMLSEASAAPPPPPVPESPAEPVFAEPDAPAVEMAAPEPDIAPATPKPRSDSWSGSRWLHIHVSELDTGRNRVRVNVPLGLVNFGLRVGARFTDEVNSDMMNDVLDALRGQEISGTLVEVEDMDDNERVHIFID
jgi:hypothetical protein